MRKTLIALPMMVLLILPIGAWSAGASPTTTPTQIKHVIIIMQENHTFDNFFGTFPGVNGIQNDPPGVQPYHITGQITKDMCHSWACAHTAYDGGKMDQFLQVGTSQAFGYYDGSNIPYYWSLAKNYTLFDNYFSSVMGPSLPNHVYMVAGQDSGIINNSITAFSFNPIMTELDQSGISWRYYAGYAPGFSGWNALPGFVQYQQDNWGADLTVSKTIFSDISTGSLPQVSWVMPPADSASDHPPYPLNDGQAWVQSVISAIQKSGYCSSSAIFLSWDDYGGWYDHVVPPQVDQNGYGFRVPLILISPFAKTGYIDHTLSDHSSLLAFIEDNFNMGNLGARDATANDLGEALKLGALDSGNALTVTRIAQGANWTGSYLLNITFSNNYYRNIKGTVVADFWRNGVPAGLVTEPLSINPTKSHTSSIVLPGGGTGQNIKYVVMISVLAPDGAVVARPYLLLLSQPSAVNDSSVNDSGQDS